MNLTLEEIKEMFPALNWDIWRGGRNQHANNVTYISVEHGKPDVYDPKNKMRIEVCYHEPTMKEYLSGHNFYFYYNDGTFKEEKLTSDINELKSFYKKYTKLKTFL